MKRLYLYIFGLIPFVFLWASTSIKDPQLSKILNKNYSGIKLDSITELIADNAIIENLYGCESMKNLQTVSFSNNRIHSVQPLAHLQKLKNVNLSHNQIKVASIFIQLPELETLDLSYNQITQCFFCTFSRLISLDISHNQIQQIHGSGNNHNNYLTYIDASCNPLNSWTNSFNAPYLKSLILNETSIQNLANIVKQHPQLEILSVENCPYLKNIQALFKETPKGIVCNIESLRTLNISENYLTDATSQKLLKEIRAGNLLTPITLNSSYIAPKPSNNNIVKINTTIR